MIWHCLNKRVFKFMMSNYIESFVAGYGVTFEHSKRNLEALKAAPVKWREIASGLSIDDNSIVMFCGAQNNGKSSLARFVINQYLGFSSSNHEDIDDMDNDAGDDRSPLNRYAYYVDFDPGQPEMTTPGMVSAHIIRSTSKPLTCPTYLNLSQHETVAMSSVGGANMSVNPRMYILNCRYIYNQVRSHQSEQVEKRPIFINTMGHIRNVGLAILMDVIKICRPTNLVVLNIETDPMRTIYADLSPTAMEAMNASFYYETSGQSKGLNYKYDLHNLDFTFAISAPTATKNRTALQVAYFSTITEALYKPIMQLNVKYIPFNSVSFCCISSYPLKVSIVLELLYQSWVHLVKLRKQPALVNTDQDSVTNPVEGDDNVTPICNIIDDVSENFLIGCGIVSDVDIEQRRLAIITPLSQEILDNEVNCIIKPLSIQVPREILKAAI